MLKKLVSFIVAIGIIFGINTNVFASEAVSENTDSNGKVVQIMLPDENGNMQVFKGEEAQYIYDTIESNPIRNSQEFTNDITEYTGPMERGMFTYKYRFVKKMSGTTWGVARRISEYAGNGSSATQKKSITASTNVSWNINANLTGKFKSVFESAVGIGWSKSSGFSETFEINVVPKKRVWLEFKPLLNYVSGSAQKYYVTRGPNRREIIEENKSVYSTSPSSVTLTIGGKKIQCPDGAYIWKEDGNYNSI